MSRRTDPITFGLVYGAPTVTKEQPMSDARLTRQRARAVETLRHLSQYADRAADRIESGTNPGDSALAHNLLALAADAAPLLAVVDNADWAIWNRSRA